MESDEDLDVSECYFNLEAIRLWKHTAPLIVGAGLMIARVAGPPMIRAGLKAGGRAFGTRAGDYYGNQLADSFGF